MSFAPSSYIWNRVSNNHMSIIARTLHFSLDYKSRKSVMVVCFSSIQWISLSAYCTSVWLTLNPGGS